MSGPTREGQFKLGNPGGPGRPKGARSKLGEAFLEAMMETFKENGPDGKPAGIYAIRQTRDADPAAYVKVLAALLPKELTGADGEAITTEMIYRWAAPQPE